MSHRLSCDCVVCFRFLYVCIGVCHSYFCVVVLPCDVLLSLLLLVKKKKGSSMDIYI